MKKELGHFIVIEGIDGTGKSSLVKNITNSLRNLGVKANTCAAYPTDEGSLFLRRIWIERKVRPVTILSIISELRYRLLVDTIIPNLLAGITVVADRWNEATMAYQGGGDEIDPAVVQYVLGTTVDIEAAIAEHEKTIGMSLDEETRSTLVQTLVAYPLIYLEGPISVSRDRMQVRGEALDAFEVKPDEFFERIKASYEEVFTEREQILPGMLHRFDCSLSQDELTKQAMGVLVSGV